MKIMRSFKKAFSLAEMAIVITVISLIVGIMSFGNSLAESNKLRVLASEVLQYYSAVQVFQETYDSLPGDFLYATNYWSTASNGNGNGTIEANPSSESLYAWNHLGLARMIKESYTGTSTSSVPSSKAYDGLSYVLRGRNAFNIGGNSLEFATLNGYFANIGFLTPVQTYNLDVKIDDGYASTGRLIGCDDGPGSVDGYCSRSWAYSPASPVSYALSNSTKHSCVTFFLLQGTGFVNY